MDAGETPSPLVGSGGGEGGNGMEREGKGERDVDG